MEPIRSPEGRSGGGQAADPAAPVVADQADAVTVGAEPAIVGIALDREDGFAGRGEPGAAVRAGVSPAQLDACLDLDDPIVAARVTVERGGGATIARPPAPSSAARGGPGISFVPGGALVDRRHARRCARCRLPSRSS